MTRAAANLAMITLRPVSPGLLATALLLVLLMLSTHRIVNAAQDDGYQPLSVAVIPEKVSEHVWFVRGLSGMVSHRNEGFNSNAAFVVTDEGVVVFDALGTPVLGMELKRQIQLITDKPVRKVIISHYHSDHFYGLEGFVTEKSGDEPEVIAHRSVQAYLQTQAPLARLKERRQSLAPWVTQNSRVIPPTRYIDSIETFELGGVRFELRPAGPGHTPEDLTMLVQPDGVLMSGDLVVAGRIPFVGDADSKAWLKAIDRLGEAAPTVIVPGHGKVSHHAIADLDLTRQYLNFVRQEMARAVDELMSFEEAYETIDWSRFEQLPAFAGANRINAYNVFLQMEQQALNAKQ